MLWMTADPSHLAGRLKVNIHPLAVVTAVSHRIGDDVAAEGGSQTTRTPQTKANRGKFGKVTAEFAEIPVAFRATDVQSTRISRRFSVVSRKFTAISRKCTIAGELLGNFLGRL